MLPPQSVCNTVSKNLARRIAVLLDYDGTDFVGWQFQANGRSVQGELERAVEHLFGEKVRVLGAGRTDSGVHAWGQVAQFELVHRISTEHLPAALNSSLARDVRVLDAREIPPEFNVRRDVLRKRYCYYLADSAPPPAVHRRWIAWQAPRLSIARMREASRHWLGAHDFSSFRAADCAAKSPERRLEAVRIGRIVHPGFSDDDGPIAMVFEARSFLKHQIRTMVGTLRLIGAGTRDPDWAREVLLARTRAAAGPTFSPVGLILERIEYEPLLFSR